MKRSMISMISVLTFCAFALSASSAMAINGPLANATVSFGQWETETDPPLDRILGDPGGGVGNNHELHPQIAIIKEGGSVNFIISGGHVVAVYDDGTKPNEISLAIETPCAVPTPSPILIVCSPQSGSPPAPTAGGILSQSAGRIYRGAFLNVNPARRDGVEVVQFTKPGTYLVICARKNHFAPTSGGVEMYGFVKVLPGK